jgi:protoporphyrinogen oxidase
MSSDGRVVVVGAGPAGLAAAWELTKHGIAPVVIDRNDRVGGLARTIWRDGFGFDLGPHRFFTKNEEIMSMWREFLGDDLLEVDRLTRIYYRQRFFSYPLKPVDALKKLGPLTTARALASYGAQRLKRSAGDPDNFEEWITRQFGKVLYETFFKSYTEKVWGIPCKEIGKEWAGQRIKGLNLSSAIKNAFGSGNRDDVRSLVERFHYPRRGAGELYDRIAERLEGAGTTFLLGETVTGVETDGGRVRRVVCEPSGRGIDVEHAFISAPITALIEALSPVAPDDVLTAAKTLYYRSHITVNLAMDRESPFPDNWIYIHAPNLRMARIANYASFTRDMIPREGTAALSVEYFCFESDDLWMMSDEDLVKLAVGEMRAADLLGEARVLDGFVVREADSYPAYYLGHRDHFDVLADHLSRFDNLDLIGRAGMYRYNNQDHASLTGLYAVRNHLGETNVDLFEINPEDTYIEEIRATRAGA